MGRTRFRWTNVAIVVGVAMLVCAAQPSAREPPTAVHNYQAFKAGRIAPDLTVIDQVRGECWTASGRMNRRYAWRCMSDHFIYDPCFSATRNSRVVACPNAPWSKRVHIMRITKPLPRWRDYAPTRAAPWGVWTTNGKRCFLLSHWQGEVAGKLNTYNCVGGGVLAGFADPRPPLWKIYYAPSWRSKRLTRVGITDAWV